ncbi:MAG: hypothetical protein AAGE03_06130, partial [Pseudomonadota bacterium]
YLRRYGFQARTIIDVGVLDGTPFLYDAFPDRHFVLIDPLEESRALTARFWAQLDHDFHLCALGAVPGEIELEIDPARLARTSGDRRISTDRARLERRRIPVRPLDAIAADLPGPLGLKIDTKVTNSTSCAGLSGPLPDANSSLPKFPSRNASGTAIAFRRSSSSWPSAASRCIPSSAG